MSREVVLCFPKEKCPHPIPMAGGTLAAVKVPLSDFMKLTKIPIIIYYGDNIPDKPMANPGQDGWRARLEMARLWRDCVNRHGGDVTVVHLPEIGIKRQYTLPVFRFKQCRNSRLNVGMVKEKRIGLSRIIFSIVKL